jgi:Mrp family chromosome partitioning ATPase
MQPLQKKEDVMKVVVKALLRWAWIFLLCGVIGWFGGKELIVLLPPTYQATAIVQLNAPHNTSSPSQAILPVSAYAVMVTSDSVLGTVLKSYPRLNRQSLGKQLVVTPNPSGSNFTISVTLPNAKEAASFVNDLARSLVMQQNAQIKTQYDTQLQLLQSEISQEQKTIDALNQKILQIPADNTTQIQQYSTEVDQHRALQTQYYADQQGLVTQKALYSEPLSVIQTAAVPTKPSSLAGMIPWTLAAILIMFIIGGVIIYYLEQGADRVHSVYALQQKVSLPLLGTLRWTQPGPEYMPLRMFSELQHPYVEDCRVMMADILFRAEEADAHVLAITGMKAGAGTSSIAAQLAALLALSRRRVLLIDANLHQPSLYARLDVTNEAGLARMLEDARLMKVGVASGGSMNHDPIDVMDNMTIEKYIIPTQLQNLYLLPAGKSSVNPTSLLSMPEMGLFLKWAAQHSDYVIIDCPALSQSEVHVLGSLSDQAYVVIDATQDRIKQVVEAKDELLDSSVKLCGFIVNKLGRWM